MARKYQVQAGDTLSTIAQRFYGDETLFNLIAAANQLANPNKIAVGQTLSIPDLPTHWDVVQVNGNVLVEKTGALVVKIPCPIPAGMRLVIEHVSGSCIDVHGTVTPLDLGELDSMNLDDAPVASFPWIQSIYADDSAAADLRRFFAFHTPTRLYVAGPTDHLTFGGYFFGLDGNQEGSGGVSVSVSGYLEANPPV